MVTLTAVPTPFQARVLVARLGADGILWELRSNVGAPYNLGGVEVLVREDQLEEARQLLLVDEIEAALDHDDGDDVDPSTARRSARSTGWLVVALIVLLCGAVLLAKLLTLA